VSISYRRGDKEMVAQVILKNKNNSTSVIRGEEKAEGSTSLGANFESLPGEELKRLNVTSGVKITGLTTGKLRSAGIRDGFIITHVDKKPVSSAEELKNTLESKKGGVLIEGIYPNGMRAYYAFGM
jgi:S1-C subfamily serine protease